jgi:Ala-tRNA(Pro) deacylase
MQELLNFLDAHGISYERFDHPAVFTCEEGNLLCPPMPGAKIKNLFITNRNGSRYYIVSIKEDKRADLKALEKELGETKLHFASAEAMKTHLGVEPGSVTILGLFNDKTHQVELILDETLRGEALQCHPLVNTATLVISAEDIQSFITATQSRSRFLLVPERSKNLY